MGRATQGVKLINIKDNDSIAAVAKVMHEEDVVDLTDENIIENDTEIDNGTEIENNEEDNNNQE